MAAYSQNAHSGFSFELAPPLPTPRSQKRPRDPDAEDDDDDIHPSHFQSYDFTAHIPPIASPHIVPPLQQSQDDNQPVDEDYFDPDDPDDGLLHQTLNQSGKPKRPMNAFMIFARKRRPQVSTEFPNLRTGEISKVLSKEWLELDKTQKQYFLDKAKVLKDRFNTKYPDYVYTRRPNNTRKKRKSSDASSIGRGEDGDYEPAKPVIPSQRRRHSPQDSEHQHSPAAGGGYDESPERHYQGGPVAPGGHHARYIPHRESPHHSHHPHQHHQYGPNGTPPSAYGPYDSEYNVTPSLATPATNTNPYALQPIDHQPPPRTFSVDSTTTTPQQSFTAGYAPSSSGLRSSDSHESLNGISIRSSRTSWPYPPRSAGGVNSPQGYATSRPESALDQWNRDAAPGWSPDHQHPPVGLGMALPRPDSTGGLVRVGGRAHSNSVSSIGRPGTGMSGGRPHSSSFSLNGPPADVGRRQWESYGGPSTLDNGHSHPSTPNQQQQPQNGGYSFPPVHTPHPPPAPQSYYAPAPADSLYAGGGANPEHRYSTASSTTTTTGTVYSMPSPHTPPEEHAGGYDAQPRVYGGLGGGEYGGYGGGYQHHHPAVGGPSAVHWEGIKSEPAM